MFKASTATEDLGEVVQALKSAAEPTRLRLLYLLSQAEYTVGELATVLNQSQPRISRHLRLLTEAGFLHRFREQQCVYYRAPGDGRHLAWLRQVLSMADPDAPLLKRDRERSLKVAGDRARSAAAAGAIEANELADAPEWSRLLLEELGPAPVGELLDIGTGAGLMLQILGPRARRAVGLDISAPALRLARTRVHGTGLAHCEFRRADMYSLPYEDASFDTVSIDRVLAAAERPGLALAEAARALRPDGRMILIEDFDQMEAGSADNPLSQLRRWLAAAGMNADRLRPCDLGGHHVIVALAHPRRRLPGRIDSSQLAGLA